MPIAAYPGDVVGPGARAATHVRHPHVRLPHIRHPQVRHPDPLRGIGSALAVGVVVSGVYLASGGRLGLPCPLRTLTGLDCPFCGSTRMGAALMRGDLGAAWHFNPVTLVATGVLGLWAALLVAERTGLVARATGRRSLPRPGPRTRRAATLAGAVVLAAFAIARNLPVGPLAGWKV